MFEPAAHGISAPSSRFPPTPVLAHAIGNKRPSILDSLATTFHPSMTIMIEMQQQVERPDAPTRGTTNQRV
ncbi:hypothetical protein AMTR_s04400p00006200 [Amborella trichopoda]|uniref:Uncharacterized protein n=1 Tax=Amborella trichopoda TaxID=13333 RepID=U5CLR2_AMBTC|nr:hypothetical protein AMTR_s04400p00006200 [Amborella trichopoda]